MVAHLIQFATDHYILVAIFVVLLVALLVNELRRGGQSLSNGQLTALVNADKALVIDIRPSKEYSAGHIVGALNIPQDKLANRMAELEAQSEDPDRCRRDGPAVRRGLRRTAQGWLHCRQAERWRFQLESR